MRCSQRKIACYYPSRPARFTAVPTVPSPVTLTASGSDFLPDNAGLDETLVDFLVSSCHTEPVNHLWTSRKSPCVHHPVPPWAPAEVPDQSTQVADTPSLGLTADDGDILGVGNVDADFFFDFTDNTTMGKDIAARPPLAVAAAPRRLDLAGLHAALETNFSYAMDRIRAAPSNMLMENQTPWCHPLLYRESMPRVMQGKNHQCLRCCVLTIRVCG